MCGIWGIINTKKSRFNKQLFNILGTHNDSRGGDSCGIFIDGNVEYGVDTLKLYSKFLKTSNILKTTSKCKIALGHCRKASVGLINESTAQPVVIKNADGVAEFVVMHNGTIYNYKALANKYIPDVDITGLTDSQVMARIFYHCGYDCLSEYFGGAVFVIVDYRKEEPQVLLWKGASKQNMYSFTEIEERPFYFIQTNDTLVFSSLYNYIESAFSKDTLTLIPNQLVEVRGDDMYLVKDYSRKEVAQQLPSNYSSSYYKYMYGYEESDYQAWDNTNKVVSNHYIQSLEDNENSYILKVSKEGVYYMDDIPIHGNYHVNKFGNIFKTPSEDTIECWFWDGVMLYGRQEYSYLKNVCNYFNLKPDELKWCCPEILNYVSPYPIKDPDYTGTTEDKWFKCTDLENIVPYTGILHLFTETKQNFCSSGDITTTVYSNKGTNFETLKRLIEKKTIDIAKLYKILYNQC